MDLTAAFVLVVAVAISLWPVSLPTSESSPVQSLSFPIGSSIGADTLDAQQVVSNNILSASRRAPERRYLSPEAAAADEFRMPAAFEPTGTPTAAAATARGDEDGVPTLYGTVNTDGVWRALLRLSAADANPSLLKEGDKRGAYRVVSIRANAVIVAGPSGQRTLRLARPAPGDSIGNTL